MHKYATSTDRTAARRAAIARLLRRERIASQADLAVRLERLGFHATQATVSRDLRDLDVVRRHDAEGGYYAPSDRAAPGDPFGGLVTAVERAGNLLVIRADPGAAQTVGRRLDEAAPEGVLGTIAGDDTLLIVCRTAAHAQRHARAWHPFVRRAA